MRCPSGNASASGAQAGGLTSRGVAQAVRYRYGGEDRGVIDSGNSILNAFQPWRMDMTRLHVQCISYDFVNYEPISSMQRITSQQLSCPSRYDDMEIV